MHHGADPSSSSCTVYACRAAVSGARPPERNATRSRRLPSQRSPTRSADGSSGSVRSGSRGPGRRSSFARRAQVERLAYTRTQAAQALGIGRSTFTQPVLPYVETVETPWGTKLIPADELERLLARVATPGAAAAQAGANRPAAGGGARRRRTDPQTRVPPVSSLRQIADRLNADGTPTAHGGARWWASTVRSVLGR